MLGAMREARPSERDVGPDATASLPAFDPAWAVFLDVDGTLLEFGERPAAVTIRPGLLTTLDVLRRRIPLALISGRAISDLDRLFAPLRLPAAGQHGAERRSRGGRIHTANVPGAGLAGARRRLAAWARAYPRIALEDKGLSLAMHYRGAPELAAEARRAAHDELARLGGDYVLGVGQMVVEIRPKGWDKGRAVMEFMGEPPFAGRVPVVVGDDVTDEDGFAAANRLGGQSIKVGAGATVARWRLAGVTQVLAWLDRYARWLEPPPAGG
ncbi:MAG: trehalose-phosphatase [Acidobacteria bacterium]|nr:MAG: trehalose-phosphatase [Acidobacteriota bacterium]